MKSSRFPDRIEENPDRVTEADLVVGIPSFNEKDSIKVPTACAARGLKAFFPDKRGVIINCDNGSSDGTREAFLSEPTEVPKIYLSTAPGVKGKGNNILNLLQRARELGAEGIALLDADVKNATPEWIRRLLAPLYDGYAYVSPLYVQDRYEGTFSNSIVYPLTRSLYGKRVRQPVGGEFGISAKAAEMILQEPVEECVSGYGIDIWMTTISIVHGLPLCQVFLGGPKVHRTEDPYSDKVLPVFKNNVETVFRLMEKYYDSWKNVRWSKPIVTLELGGGAGNIPEEKKNDLAGLYEKFREGLLLYEKNWERILHGDVFKKLREVSRFPLETFEFPALMWVLILFDFALDFKQRKTDPDQLLEFLLPLYFGRTCSMVLSTSHMNPNQVEVYMDDQCRVFEETKPYLEYLWEKR